MWNTKLCLGTSRKSFRMPLEEQIRLFKRVGFDAFFTDWQPGDDVAALRRVAEEIGIEYQSIHAPSGRTKSIWQSGQEGEAATDELIACLRICKKNHIPLMVAHAYCGFDVAETENERPTEIGLLRFVRLIDEAERLGVRIAFENAEGEEFFTTLMEAFCDRSCVGLCWDTGHELCYNHGRDILARYGGRLFGTHLNDNLGIRDFNGHITWLDDLHLLPFDGITDWHDIADRLNEHAYGGILTFEVSKTNKPGRHENDIYEKMSDEEYVTEAYKRACRVATLRNRRRGDTK